jgi:hypothetical protein
LRYGIVPNSAGAATANTTALKALLDPTKTGPIGRLIFPPLTGADTYYFNGIVQVRDGIRMDLMGCTINFAKTYAASDNLMGFFTFIRDITIENGSIVVNYNGTGGVNAGMAMRIGARDSYPFASYTSGIWDKDTLADHGIAPMGNILLRNLRISTNNPSAASSTVVLLLGGLRNCIVENVVIDGGGAADTGIYYEFGAASTNGFPSTTAKWSSSHARNMHFRNIEVRNLNAAISGGAGISLVGSYACTVENLTVTTANCAFIYRPGEALFFRVWAGQDDAGGKRCITLRNIVGNGITSTGLALVGAEEPNGYLNNAAMIAAGLPVLTPSQRTDLMSFSVDGFAFKGCAVGIAVSGAADIRNGHINGCTSCGLRISDDCVQFTIDNVRIRESASVGVLAAFADSLAWSPPRKKIGSIRNSQIAGNTGAGIAIDNCESVLVENCRLGYNTAYDGSAEATQTSGVTASTGASGVVCRGNFVTTSGGAVAYGSAGPGDRGNAIYTPRGTNTYTASAWIVDGVARANAGDFSAKTSALNTVNKYAGKMCYDQSNTRLMIAQGSTDVSTWKVVDNSATVTPA